MASLKDFLPAPKDAYILSTTPPKPSTSLTVIPSIPSTQAGVSKVVSLPQTAGGVTDFSAIVRQGENAKRTVHTAATALIEKPRSQALRSLPTQAETDLATARTRQALQQVIDGKIAASKTSDPDKLSNVSKPTYIRYTPANSNAKRTEKRIIKMVEAPVDPMLPPKFSQRKAPVNPPSPPVPVMHSPERKLSKEEAAKWRIPPVVSNWKNNRGYTISLEKRLAADGRGQVDHSINDRFADMAEALYKAERTAREDVEKRAQMQRKVALRAKEAKERELRELAERARRERKGYLGLSEATDTESQVPSVVRRSEADARRATEAWLGPTMEEARPVRDEAPPVMPGRKRTETLPRRPRRSRFAYAAETVSASVGTVSRGPEISVESGGLGGVSGVDVRRRDIIREERREERERDLRQSRVVHGESTGPTLKRSKLSRDVDRDLSERVALGQGVKGNNSGEVMYDQRLFNQGGRADGTLAGGYGADDAYNLYDRPLFTGGRANEYQYKPPQNDKAENGEGGASRGADVAGTRASQAMKRRDRPVEFERDSELKSAANDDPYGLDKFLNDAREFDKSKQ